MVWRAVVAVCLVVSVAIDIATCPGASRDSAGACVMGGKTWLVEVGGGDNHPVDSSWATGYPVFLERRGDAIVSHCCRPSSVGRATLS